MPALLLLAAALTLLQGGRVDPARIVRDAERAIEGDSARTVAARLRARIAHDASDRGARLELAALARLTNDTVEMRGALRPLLADSTRAPDAIAVHARLTLAGS